MTPIDKRQYDRDRKAKADERIKMSLANGEDPFEPKSDTTAARFFICEYLLMHDRGLYDQPLDINETHIVEAFAAIIFKGGAADQDEMDEAKDILNKAFNALRVSGAVRKKGGKIFLHKIVIEMRNEINRDDEEEQMKDIPGFGIF